jgi:hypothetical protein
MRSTGKAVLVAGALASGSLFGIGTYTALAQGFGGMPGSHAMPAGNPYSVNPTGPRGMSGATDTPQPTYGNPPASTIGAGGAPSSPYNNYLTTPPSAVSARPSPDAVRTSFSTPGTGTAGSPSPSPAASSSPYGAAMPTPAPTNGAAPANSTIKPYLATVPSQAEAPKPKGWRKFFSYLWHGGSSPEDENKHAKYDYSTGRTDLPNARPWMSPPSSK